MAPPHLSMSASSVIKTWHILPLICLMLTGCIYEDLPPCPPQVLNVEFIWGDEPPASAEGMNVIFYPLDADGQRWIFNIPSPYGGRVELPVGSYQAVAYNAGTRHIDFCDTGGFSTIRATTLYDGAEPADSVTPTVPSPDMLYSASLSRMTVTGCGVEYIMPDGTEVSCGNNTVRMWPQRRTPRYNVILEDVDKLSHVRSISADISGLSAGCLLYSGERRGPSVTTALALNVNDSTSASGSFLNFGYLPSVEQDIELIFTLVKNKKVRYTGKVSDIIRNSPTPFDVDIIIRGIQVPDQGTADDDNVGADVDVEGWKVEIIDINVDPFHPR